VVGMAMLSIAPSALAAPDITLDKDAPGSVLFGDDSRVTLQAANPGVCAPFAFGAERGEAIPTR
jgi:hypothetical protein